MARPFRICVADLSAARSEIVELDQREALMGGCGLAAGLYEKYGLPQEPAHHPEQPMIFAIGPLTGYYPLMSKVVLGFKSPYRDEYGESHAGGRLALALRFAGYDALVVKGRAAVHSCLVVGSREFALEDVHYLWGRDVFTTGKVLRRMHKKHSGHRSILRIGPAGENQVAYASINVDTYRHFGRLGGGAVMGGKNLKGIIVIGDGSFFLPEGKAYPKLYQSVYEAITEPKIMHKYHDLGTAVNLSVLNELKALPWSNLQATRDPGIDGISGETFARDLLLRQTACAGCPIGCIHVGLLRERFGKEHEYFYRQVSYDYEPIFGLGSMLGMQRAQDVLTLLEDAEKQGLDVISSGVALAWATEALEKGLVSEQETLEPLQFNELTPYRRALEHLGAGKNDFYRTLGQGALAAARVYGGEDFACVLGQEMAGYATGETYAVSQAYGFRHSHLDSAGYAFDQTTEERDVQSAVDFMVEEERLRVGTCCMVACLFARKVYTEPRLQECLSALGHEQLAAVFPELSREVQQKRWQLKFATGYDPDTVTIPKRYREVVTWKGPMDEAYMNDLAGSYTKAIRGLAEK